MRQARYNARSALPRPCSSRANTRSCPQVVRNVTGAILVLNRLAQANRQFRLQEAAGLCRLLAEEYPGAIAWADSLDDYHAFLMAMLPGREQDAAPFSSVVNLRQESRIANERRRLCTLWRRAEQETKAYVVAYWAIANWDGIRGAAWLLRSAELGRILERLPDHLQVGLREIAGVFDRPPPVEYRGTDLYIALQAVADALPASGACNSVERADEFRWSALPLLSRDPTS